MSISLLLCDVQGSDGYRRLGLLNVVEPPVASPICLGHDLTVITLVAGWVRIEEITMAMRKLAEHRSNDEQYTTVDLIREILSPLGIGEFDLHVASYRETALFCPHRLIQAADGLTQGWDLKVEAAIVAALEEA
jgi:hypothetical protein